MWNKFDERMNQLRESMIQRAYESKRKIREQGFTYNQFSKKQLQILTWWHPSSPVKDMDGIIADGAIRSGKTLSMSLSFVIWAMEMFNHKEFAMCGKTVSSFNRNVLFLLIAMLKGRGYKVIRNISANMFTVSSQKSTNVFYIFGGKDEGSQDLIQGVTLAGVFLDEVALMPQSFVNQATGRCSEEGSKYWFNCNPAGPMHWFKTDWIDCSVGILGKKKSTELSEKGKKIKNIVYLHFTMDDNLSLSEAIKQRYRNMYSGVFFLRYIKGLWAVAEGLIYTMYNEDNEYDDDSRPKGLEYIAMRTISLDYGTTNPCVYLDIYDDAETIWVDREYRWDSHIEKQGQKTDAQYADDMRIFMGDNPEFVCDIVADPSAASFIAELKSRGYTVKGADNEVLDGIRTVASLFERKKLRIHKRCVGLITELKSYVWDEKHAKEHGEERPVKQLDHGPDALRYYCMTKIPKWRIGA